MRRLFFAHSTSVARSAAGRKRYAPGSRLPIARRSGAFDPRILPGGSGEYRRSYCDFSVSPIAIDEKGGMQRNYWYSISRTASSAGASTMTSMSYPVLVLWTPSRTKAAASAAGSSRGRNRAPVPSGPVRRSSR